MTTQGAASHDQGVLIDPPPDFAAKAHVGSMEQYREQYAAALKDPEEFWADEARATLRWRKPFMRILDWNFEEPKIRWFEDGTLNVSENCLDRHVAAGRGGRTAIIWE